MTSLVELILASEELGNSLLCGTLLAEVCVRSAEQNINKKRHRVSGVESREFGILVFACLKTVSE